MSEAGTNATGAGRPGSRLRRRLAAVLGRRSAPGDVAARRRRILLVCSPGGHLQQMLALKPAWEGFEVSWATLPSSDVEHILRDEDVTLGHGPTNRSLKNLARNLLLAPRVLGRKRPDMILSTGAGLAVPFFVVGRLMGIRLVYVESLTRTRGLSLSGRMVAPFAHEMFVQWPAAVSGRARYVGSILSGEEPAEEARARAAGDEPASAPSSG